MSVVSASRASAPCGRSSAPTRCRPDSSERWCRCGSARPKWPCATRVWRSRVMRSRTPRPRRAAAVSGGGLAPDPPADPASRCPAWAGGDDVVGEAVGSDGRRHGARVIPLALRAVEAMQDGPKKIESHYSLGVRPMEADWSAPAPAPSCRPRDSGQLR